MRDIGAATGCEPPGGAAALDIALVVTVSATAYAMEQWATARGLLTIGQEARGVTAVAAGACAAIALTFVRGGSWRELGFTSPARWWTVPFWVVGILAAYLAAQSLAPVLVSQFAALPEPDLSRYDTIRGNLPAALIMAIVLPLTASIPEEIIYRGFLMNRLTRILGSGLGGNILNVVVQALVFGAVHFQWGVGGMIVTAIMGLVWGSAFLLCGRNLWIMILAHSTGHLALVAQLYASQPAAPA